MRTMMAGPARTLALMLAPILAMTAAMPVVAQTPPPPCPKTPAPLPAALSGWGRGKPVADGGLLAIGAGSSVSLTLSPVFAVAPEKTPPTGSYGGSVSFVVRTAGVYRVALGGPVWIDVVKAATPVASTAHGHGPACSPVRKMVDFTLVPGRYVLQLSGAKTATTPVLIAKR